MKRPSEQLARKLELFVETRERVVGERLKLPAESQWSTTDFEALVTALYRLICESWADEIHQIRVIAVASGPAAGDLRRFSQQINAFRQSQQHEDTPKEDKELMSWRGVVGNQSATLKDGSDAHHCGALAEQAVHALGGLVGLAKSLESDANGARQWRQFIDDRRSLDPVETLELLAGDFGIRLPYNPKHLRISAQREWSHRVKALGIADERSLAMEHVITRILAGRYIQSLPCSYSDVLDALDVPPGSDRAFGVVIAAHGLAVLSAYDDVDDFLNQLISVLGQVNLRG